jgi:hypothetical protein
LFVEKQPKKWETTWEKMEDDLKKNGRQPPNKIEDNIQTKLKTTSKKI